MCVAASMFIVCLELSFFQVNKEYHLKEIMSLTNPKHSLTGSNEEKIFIAF